MILTSQIIVAHPIGLLEVCRDVAECFETSSPVPCQLNSCKSILTDSNSMVGPCSISSYLKYTSSPVKE